MPKILRLKKGYRFTNFSEIIPVEPIAINIPEQIILHISPEMSLSASAGDTVRAGQSIAGAGDGAPIMVRASISGILTQINEKEHYREVVIKTDGKKGDILPFEGAVNSAGSLSRAGCIWAAPYSEKDRANRIQNILIRGFYTAPLGVHPGTFLPGMKEEFIEGLKLLRKIFTEAGLVLCLTGEDGLSEEMGGIEGLEVACIDRKYPSENAVLLEEKVLGAHVEGYIPTDSTLVISTQDVVQAGYAAMTGLPVLDRTVVLCGDGCEKPSALKVPLGTPVRALIEGRLAEGELSFILGNPASVPDQGRQETYVPRRC